VVGWAVDIEPPRPDDEEPMPGVYVVAVPGERQATFPDGCVFCGKHSPGAETRLLLRRDPESVWAGFLRLRAPCCPGCGWRLHLGRLWRLLRFAVVFCLSPLVGWLAALAARPFTEPLTRATVDSLTHFLLGLPFILIGALGLAGGIFGVCLWRAYFPPRFDAGVGGGDVEYQFRDRGYAERFARQNGIDLPADWKAASRPWFC
jgi:hypothetical protein